MRKTLPILTVLGLMALSACSKSGTQPQLTNASSGPALSDELKAQIVGGVVSERGARPYQVAIATRTGEQYCGGTLIHPQWVLTAAHCLGIRLQVRVGVNTLSDPEQGETISVAKAYNHPNYVAAASGYDIGLLKLSRPAKLNEYTAIAYLPSSRIDGLLVKAGKTAIVSGWGDTETGSGKGSDQLREVEIPMFPNPTECGQVPTPLPANTICGNSSEGKDSCQGDSGGPLAQSYNGKMYVLGVVSYGMDCDGHGMYTRVKPYLDWIAQVSGVQADDGGLGNTDAPAPTPAPTPTPNPEEASSYTYTGNVRRGISAYAPQSGFSLSSDATLKGELAGPDSADFDLYLEKSNGSRWVQVARSTTYNNSSESISYAASAGQYRWRIRAWNGSGEAKLVQTPRGANQK